MPSENIKDLVENIFKALSPKDLSISGDEYKYSATIANIKNYILEIREKSKGINGLLAQNNFLFLLQYMISLVV